MPYRLGERSRFGASMSLKWGERSDEGYPSESLKSKDECRILHCQRLEVVPQELKRVIGNFCAERVCIYKLTRESSCCELITGSYFHTHLTYPDCKAIKLHRVMLGLDLLRTVMQRFLSWLFLCIPWWLPCPLGSHPLSQKQWQC